MSAGHANLDTDPILACADLARRVGATAFEIGYVHDDVPIAEAGWYATATFRGAKLIADDHRSQEAACEALSRRLLRGGRCVHCGRPVTLNDDVPGCRWRRMGPRWEGGCSGSAHSGPNRAQRRKKKR